MNNVLRTLCASRNLFRKFYLEFKKRYMYMCIYHQNKKKRISLPLPPAGPHALPLRSPAASRPRRIPSLTAEPRSRSRSPRSPPRCAADRWAPPDSPPLSLTEFGSVQTAARAGAVESRSDSTRRRAPLPPVVSDSSPLYIACALRAAAQRP